MGILVIKCPHCMVENVAADTIGYRVIPSTDTRPYPDRLASFGAVCNRCLKPVAAIMKLNNLHMTEYKFGEACSAFMKSTGDAGSCELTVAKLWPELPKPNIPDHIPEAVKRTMLQAERNFSMPDNEEAAAIMYRRTLEVALKEKYPALKGSLAAQVKQLVADRIVPQTIADWADEIRVLGNAAAHDVPDVDRDELTMIRGFADTFLRYLYTLPAMVAARREPP